MPCKRFHTPATDYLLVNSSYPGLTLIVSDVSRWTGGDQQHGAMTAHWNPIQLAGLS